MSRIRKSAGILCLTAILFLSSCQKQEDTLPKEEYVQGMDYQYMYDNRPMAEAPEGYYFRVSDFLYYIGKDTMEPVPLCSKPNCLHQQEQDPEKVADCGAFFRDPRAEPLLAYYDGAVYLTALKDPFDSSGAIDLIRIKTDGTERETVLELPENSGVCLIHCGYLYYTVDTYNIELDADYGVYRQSLQGGKPELIYKGQWEQGSIRSLAAYGGYLYIEESVSYFDQQRVVFEVLVQDLRTGETGPAFAHPEMADPMMPKFLNGKIYNSIYHNQDLEDSAEHYYEHFTCDLDGGNRQPADFPSDPTKAYRTDADSIWYYTIPWQRDQALVLRQLDEEGNVLAEWPAPDYGASADMIPGGKEHFFFTGWEETGEGNREFVLSYMEKNPEDGILKPQVCMRIREEDYRKAIVRN